MLAKLKTFLKERKIDYFLLPNSDEFFSEYLAEDKKLIQRLTGFTGSNATVIFGQKKSFFFTDGRYILQAKNQLDLSEFEVFDLATTPLLSRLADDVKLGVDPKLTSVTFAKILQKKFPNLVAASFEKGGVTRSVTEDFGDTNSDSASLKSSSAAFAAPHPFSKEACFFISDEIAGCNSKTKITQILQGLNADALLLTKPENICWLLNIRGRDLEFTPIFLTYALLDKSGEVELFRKKIPPLKNEIKKIQLDESSTNYWLYQELQKSDFELINKTDPIDLIKSQKNSAEIFGAIKAHEEDGLALTKFLFWLTQQNETDEILAAKKLLEFRQESPNFFSESFAAISGFASNGAVIHYHSTPETNKKIHAPLVGRACRDLGMLDSMISTSSIYGLFSTSSTIEEEATPSGSLYLIDSGGQYLGGDFCGTTDVTRTVAIGTPSEEMRENFTRVLKGHIAIARAKFPRGTSGAQLDVLAREHLWRAQLDYQHGTGHGVGSFLSVHEGPCAISKRSHQELLCGMILSNEPGFYKEDEYGIRIENLMLVEEATEKNFLQFRTLTLAPIDTSLIDFKMLTYPEKKWLISYHQEIYEKLSKKMSEENRNWLKKICEKFEFYSTKTPAGASPV